MKIITIDPAGKDKEQDYLFTIDGKPFCPIGSVNILLIDDDKVETPNQDNNKDNE